MKTYENLKAKQIDATYAYVSIESLNNNDAIEANIANISKISYSQTQFTTLSRVLTMNSQNLSKDYPVQIFSIPASGGTATFALPTDADLGTQLYVVFYTPVVLTGTATVTFTFGSNFQFINDSTNSSSASANVINAAGIGTFRNSLFFLTYMTFNGVNTWRVQQIV